MERQNHSNPRQPESQGRDQNKEGTDIRTDKESSTPAENRAQHKNDGGTQNLKGESHHQEAENPDREHKIDDQLDQSFPASDPPSYSQPGNALDED